MPHSSRQDIDITAPYPRALGLNDLRAPLLAEWRQAMGAVLAGYYVDGRWKREGHRFCCSPHPGGRQGSRAAGQ